MGYFILRCDYCISVSKLDEKMTRLDGRSLSSDWIDRNGTDFSFYFLFDLSAIAPGSPHITPLVNHPASQTLISCLKYKSIGVRSGFSWQGHI